ncbi:bifunctional pyr operon transcriptional regulator/uracil phosphoribosyltransferase PyrR [Pseudomonas sp. F1_0610]|uniref:bifunctional pyr operon transcriptional regulator/uracil phosphoribosyltransferase PyrR n=1 Tax=Pseudomonas sp. F1_0610 TaxID=3114284 RepID=UPI0039C0D7AD
MNLPQPEQLLSNMASQLTEYLKQMRIQQPRFVGIQTGGVWVSKALLKKLNRENEALGVLNVSFYRDDFSRTGLHPQVSPSQLPFDIEDQHIILIDDVLMSGRTIRAAMNELFDYGRPASITLVSLLDINARELPISPDIVGATIDLPDNQRIKVRGPAPLSLELKTLAH